MNGIVLHAAGREIPLRFDTQAWLDIEEKFGSLSEMYRKIDTGEKPVGVYMNLTEILSDGGARRYGGEGVTPEWMKDNLSPMELKMAVILCKAAVTKGLRRKHKDDEDGDVDVVAQELQKNAEGCSAQETPSATA